MSALSECATAVMELLNVVHKNDTGVPEDTLEMYCKWIQSKCDYLLKEREPFCVDRNHIPRTIQKVSYEYFSQKIGKVLDLYYSFEDNVYVRNKTEMTSEDATTIYCAMYLQPRKIVWIDFGFNIGKEFGGRHPAVILKNVGNNTLIVSPLSTNSNNLAPSKTVVTLSSKDVYNMSAEKNRFMSINRITNVSVYRVDTTSKVGSLCKEKYNELIEKIREYY